MSYTQSNTIIVHVHDYTHHPPPPWFTTNSREGGRSERRPMQRAKPAQRVAGAKQRPSGRGRGARGDHPEKSRRRCGKRSKKNAPPRAKAKAAAAKKTALLKLELAQATAPQLHIRVSTARRGGYCPPVLNAPHQRRNQARSGAKSDLGGAFNTKRGSKGNRTAADGGPQLRARGPSCSSEADPDERGPARSAATRSERKRSERSEGARRAHGRGRSAPKAARSSAEASMGEARPQGLREAARAEI